MHTIGFLDMKNFTETPLVSIIFVIFLIILDFMLFSFKILDFCFCFLLEIEFLVYLRLCKPFNNTNFIIIISEE